MVYQHIVYSMAGRIQDGVYYLVYYKYCMCTVGAQKAMRIMGLSWRVNCNWVLLKQTGIIRGTRLGLLNISRSALHYLDVLETINLVSIPHTKTLFTKPVQYFLQTYVPSHHCKFNGAISLSTNTPLVFRRQFVVPLSNVACLIIQSYRT